MPTLTLKINNVMEVTEKHVREIHEGGGYGNGCIGDKLRRTSNLAGWATGLAGVAAAGALGVFGNKNCGSGLNLFGNNNCGNGCGNGLIAAEVATLNGPTAFQAWTKECEDALELTRAIYRGELAQQAQRFEDRGVDVREKVAIGEKINSNEMKTQQDFFNIYKGVRDLNDATNARITEIEKREIATSTALPYQFALVDCKINNTALAAHNELIQRTNRMLEGVLVAPTTPLISGVPSYSCCCGFPPSAPSA